MCSQSLTWHLRLFGGSPQALPNPDEDFTKFIGLVRDANRKEPDVWSPYSRGPRHWVFTQDLSLYYSPNR